MGSDNKLGDNSCELVYHQSQAGGSAGLVQLGHVAHSTTWFGGKGGAVIIEGAVYS